MQAGLTRVRGVLTAVTPLGAPSPLEDCTGSSTVSCAPFSPRPPLPTCWPGHPCCCPGEPPPCPPLGVPFSPCTHPVCTAGSGLCLKLLGHLAAAFLASAFRQAIPVSVTALLPHPIPTPVHTRPVSDYRGSLLSLLVPHAHESGLVFSSCSGAQHRQRFETNPVFPTL